MLRGTTPSAFYVLNQMCAVDLYDYLADYCDLAAPADPLQMWSMVVADILRIGEAAFVQRMAWAYE